MRKLMLVISVLALSVSIGSVTASAQTQITLDGTATGGVVFTPAGSGNVSMSVGSGVSGTATGTGAFLFSGGTWSLTGGPVGLTLGFNDGVSIANYAATSGNLTLDIMSGATTELSGVLNLVNLLQASNTGTTDTSLVADLTGLGGVLAPSFASDAGIVQLTLDLSGTGYLPSLTASTSPVSITHGDITATPEPTSLVLLGTGLLSFGGLLRRRMLGA